LITISPFVQQVELRDLLASYIRDDLGVA